MLCLIWLKNRASATIFSVQPYVIMSTKKFFLRGRGTGAQRLFVSPIEQRDGTRAAGSFVLGLTKPSYIFKFHVFNFMNTVFWNGCVIGGPKPVCPAP